MQARHPPGGLHARLTWVGSTGVSTGVALRQRVQQRLRLLQVRGVKALGEPGVDRRQQRVGLGALALLLPQAAQTRGGAQLPRFGLLATGHIEGVTKVNSGGATGAGTPSDEPS